jgi:hypothetical protein
MCSIVSSRIGIEMIPNPTISRKSNPSQFPKKKKMGQWGAKEKGIVQDAHLSKSMTLAIRAMADREAQRGAHIQFIPAAMANAAGCSARTIYRELQKAIDHGILELAKKGSKACKKQSEFRFGQAWREIANSYNYQRSRGTQCPSFTSLQEVFRSTPSPLPEAQEAPPPKGGMASEKPFSETEQTLALVMAQAETKPKTIKKAILAARLENRIDQALKDAKAVLAYIKTAPKWMTSPGGIMAKAVLDPERARRLKRQANYQKTFAKRQEAKPRPAPQKSSAEMDLAAEWNFWRNEADGWPDEQRKTLHALENDRARFVSEAARLWKAGLCWF